MNDLDLIQVVEDSTNGILVEDLELLQRCCDLCEARQIIEIGSRDGGSAMQLGTKAKERGGHLFCIEHRPRRKMADNMTRYGLDGFYTMIPKSSPWVPLDLLPKEIDLLFIDGGHWTRWALADYHYFEPLVRPGGVIVFHDIFRSWIKLAIDIIKETDSDKLKYIDESSAPVPGAWAFQKIK